MISVNFARCLAKISGDGYLSKKYVRYSNTCSVLIEEFVKDMEQEFSFVHFTKGTTNTGTPFVQFSNKAITEQFLNHLPDFHSSAIYIPESVKKVGKHVKREYIRAFYDDEGCAALRIFGKTKEWKRNITLTSNSLQMLEEIKSVFLIDFSIACNKIIRNKKQDRAYVLGISGKENITKFYREIGFIHPKKKELLDIMLKSYGVTYARSPNRFVELESQLDIIKKRAPVPKKGGQLSGFPAQCSTHQNDGLLNSHVDELSASKPCSNGNG